MLILKKTESNTFALTVIENGEITQSSKFSKQDMEDMVRAYENEEIFPQEFMLHLKGSVQKEHYKKEVLEDKDLLMRMIATYIQFRRDHRNHSSVAQEDIWDDRDCYLRTISTHRTLIMPYRIAKGGM